VAKDGPPSSSGYRFGGLETFRSGLPPKAANPRGPRTSSELEAGENLAAFNNYFGRAKSIGQPLPRAQGVSPERAVVLQKLEQSEQRTFVPVVRLGTDEEAEVWLFRSGRSYMFVKKYPHGYLKSFTYRRERAIRVWRHYRKMIGYIEFVKGPLVPPITEPPPV
jgi:hypothetical protein